MTPKTKTKSPTQVRAEFRRHGKSIAEWSREHAVSERLVHEVLAGRKKGHRGQSHVIAVLLGLKDGVIAESAARATA